MQKHNDTMKMGWGRFFAMIGNFTILHVLLDVPADLLPGSCLFQHQSVPCFAGNGMRHDWCDARLHVADVQRQHD